MTGIIPGACNVICVNCPVGGTYAGMDVIIGTAAGAAAISTGTAAGAAAIITGAAAIISGAAPNLNAP